MRDDAEAISQLRFEKYQGLKIWKTASVAIVLFVVGSVRAADLGLRPLPPLCFLLLAPLTIPIPLPLQLMIFYGVQALREAGGYERGVSMCTVGAIAFLPGSFATWHLYGAWRQWPGYRYDLIPSYDE